MENKTYPGWIIPLVLAAGIAGAVLRTLELIFAFEADTGLAVPFHPATIAMAAFSAAAVLAFGLLYSRLNVMKPQGYHSAFSFHSPTIGGLLPLSSVLLIVGSALTAAPLISGLEPAEVALNLVRVALAVFSAVAVIMLARSLSRNDASGEYMFFELVPIFWVCFWLITTFMSRASDPVILDYAYELFAIISLLLFFYYAAGFTFADPSPKKALFFGSCAIYFCMSHALGALANVIFVKGLIELSLIGSLLTYMFAIIYVAAMCTSLLSNLKFKKLGMH